MEKLLQRLVTDTQSRPVPTELEQSMSPSLAEQRRRRRQPCSGQVVTATAGGPVGPDVGFTNPELVTHTVLVHADLAGQDVSAVGTPSPSCYPAGPAGPYVAGGPVGPDDCLQVLESCEKLVLDHAEPAGQHAVVLDTTESLGDAVVENILDGRPYVSGAVGIFS